MRVRLNRYEKYAGAFIISSIFLAIFSTIAIGIQNSWFSKKHFYFTQFDKAQGLVPGSQIEMAGLRAGVVETVDLGHDDKIIVRISIADRFASRIREDSTIITKRPFIIGEKILEVTVGSPNSPLKRPGSFINSSVGFDFLDMADAKNVQPYFDTLSRLAESLRLTAEAFAEPKRAKALIAMFDKINPFLTKATVAATSFKEISDQLTREKNLQIAVENFAQVSSEMNKVLKENPGLTKESAALMGRTLSTLDEALIVLKAMQRSFLLRGSVKEVLEEAKKEDAKKNRLPTGESKK